MKRVHILIEGKVTGVCFRKYIKFNADKLNIKGWVKNRSNSVEAIFEGEDSAVNQMIMLCKKGPDYAEVKNINLKEEIPKNEKTFKIIR